jgi:hypothetical protein
MEVSDGHRSNRSNTYIEKEYRPSATEGAEIDVYADNLLI